MQSLRNTLLNVSIETSSRIEGISDSISNLCDALRDSRRGDACRHSLQIISSPSETEALQYQLQSSVNHTLKNISLLARLARAHRTFIDAAHGLPSFSQITFIQVQKLVDPVTKSTNLVSLSRVFEILKLPLNQQNVQQVVHPKSTVEATQDLLKNLQKRPVHVHAEAQICQHLSQSRVSFESVFPYLGCSKLSCFMCKLFLHMFCDFETRGCHGKLITSGRYHLSLISLNRSRRSFNEQLSLFIDSSLMSS